MNPAIKGGFDYVDFRPPRILTDKFQQTGISYWHVFFSDLQLDVVLDEFNPLSATVCAVKRMMIMSRRHYPASLTLGQKPRSTFTFLRIKGYVKYFADSDADLWLLRCIQALV